jgi:hypothetical protein
MLEGRVAKGWRGWRGGSPKDGEEPTRRSVVGRTVRPEDGEERRRSRTIVRRKKATDGAVALTHDRSRLRAVVLPFVFIIPTHPPVRPLPTLMQWYIRAINSKNVTKWHCQQPTY